MRRLLPALVILVAILCVAAIFYSYTNTAKGHNSSQPSPNVGNDSFAWELPEKLTFCGEEVPLDIPEVKERAEREFLLNLQSKGQIVLYMKRSGRFFPMYERVLKELQLPDDLKYVSVAESALFMARSSKDAVGLWQFMPATARAMGLVVTDQVDERRHPEKSTYAAAKYLKAGYQSNGSWTNAAAGYNMGHENFSENTRYQQASDFYSLYLNEETSRYVLRIAVIKHILEHAAEHGVILPQNGKYVEQSCRIITERESIPSMSQWAQDHGSNYKDVKLLNPWILGRTLPTPSKGGSWEICLPK
ncbi:MAG: lytic transglycosylase domain-containing protein [Ignavibacteria bacterium]|nr:lytic transglycosylase domain-containing protein [Ignavibacteria bacterium]